MADATDSHNESGRVRAQLIPTYTNDGDRPHLLENWIPPAQVKIDDYSATLKDVQQRVNADALANQGLIAKGHLPVVEMALHQKAPPNAHAHATGNANLDFSWDAKGNLSTATYKYDTGATETATFKDGVITSDHVVSKGTNLLFQYDASQHVRHIEIDRDEQYDLAQDGTVTHALLNSGDKKELFNQPGHHSFTTTAQMGSIFEYNYTPEGKFLYGNVKQNNRNYEVDDVIGHIGVLAPEHEI